MSIRSQSSHQRLRTTATTLAAGAVAYAALAHGGSILAARSAASPAAVATAEATAPTHTSASSYDPMTDYVETLLWWHENPDWMPAGFCGAGSS
jgi:hypothetical protein